MGQARRARHSCICRCVKARPYIRQPFSHVAFNHSSIVNSLNARHLSWAAYMQAIPLMPDSRGSFLLAVRAPLCTFSNDTRSCCSVPKTIEEFWGLSLLAFTRDDQVSDLAPFLTNRSTDPLALNTEPPAPRSEGRTAQGSCPFWSAQVSDGVARLRDGPQWVAEPARNRTQQQVVMIGIPAIMPWTAYRARHQRMSSPWPAAAPQRHSAQAPHRSPAAAPNRL